MVSEVIRDFPIWVTFAGAIASAPLLVGGVFWVLSLPTLLRFALGVLLGLAIITTFHLIQLHRSQARRSKALHIAQLCQLDAVTLRRLLPLTRYPSWVGLAPDFEKRGSRWSAPQNECTRTEPMASVYFAEGAMGLSQRKRTLWMHCGPLYYMRRDFVSEEVTWLNKELEEIWPSLNEATSGLLKMILQSVLDPYKFSIIRKITIKSITFGTLSPLLGGVKFTEASADEAMLEVELDWRHGQDSKIVIELQTTGPVLTVQIKDIVIFGVLRVIFKPLKEQFPGFGAVTISLREPPTVDFHTKFLGGDILMIPGIDNAVDNIIRTALTDILVWPNRLVIPVMPGDYSYLQLKPVGQLEVDLVEAQQLSKQDIFGESDPYAVIYIRRKQGCIRTSSVKSNTNSPVWHEKFTLDVEDQETQKLTVRILDDDFLKIADFMGAAELPLSMFEPNEKKDLWVDLVEDPKKPGLISKGKIHLCIIYKPFSASETDTSRVEEQVKQEGKL